MLVSGLVVSFKISVPKQTVHLVSLDWLVFNILNLAQTKVTAALTCMFGDVYSDVHAINWCFWRDMAIGSYHLSE